MRIGEGTRALVTGASRGIGRATVEALSARGARVGLLSRSEGELAALAAQLPGEQVVLAADVGDADSVAGAVDRFVDETGGLDLAVVNAGIAHYAPFRDLALEQAEEMVRINLLGTLYTVKAALPPMLDRASGHLVVVSSGAALRAFPWGATYGATKAGQRAFAEALRHELSGTGVSLTTAYPGEVKTHLHDHELDRMPDWYRRDEAISPERVAAAIVKAVEEDRRHVHVPLIVRALGLNSLAPGLADRLLAALRGPTAAPRRD
jgi:NADP-dependent 3-hydroxy acid dehydrogenase YdfG